MVREGRRRGYLLDTHILIWALAGDSSLSKAQRAVVDSGEQKFVSSVVLWEIATKTSAGKLTLPADLDDLLAETGCLELPVTWEHARRLQTLPWLHRDPFDRMLLAQALVENLIIVTSDSDIRRYPIETL